MAASALVTFLARPTTTTLGTIDVNGPLGQALMAGRAKAAEARIEAMGEVAPIISAALDNVERQTVSTVAALQEQLAEAQVPLARIQRALAYAQADTENPLAWFPVLVEAGVLNARVAAEAGYSASEFAKHSSVPKDWQPAARTATA